jgi:hypothetical protein
MNKWTILTVVVCFGALAASVVEARTVRSGGGCANGQCGMATASEATVQAPSGTQTIPTAASADSTKVPEQSDVKVETTAAPAAIAAPQQRTSRSASGRFFRLRRSWR